MSWPGYWWTWEWVYHRERTSKDLSLTYCFRLQVHRNFTMILAQNVYSSLIYSLKYLTRRHDTMILAQNVYIYLSFANLNLLISPGCLSHNAAVVLMAWRWHKTKTTPNLTKSLANWHFPYVLENICKNQTIRSTPDCTNKAIKWF